VWPQEALHVVGSEVSDQNLLSVNWAEMIGIVVVAVVVVAVAFVAAGRPFGVWQCWQYPSSVHCWHDAVSPVRNCVN